MKKRFPLLLSTVLFCTAAFCQNAANPRDTTGVEYNDNDSAATVTKGSLTSKQKDSIGRALAPDEGKALVYILRPTSYGALIRMTIECDNWHIGATKAGNYIYTMLDPGPHSFRSIAENNSEMALTVEAGKTYYIKQQVKMGFLMAATGLKVLDAQEGQKYLRRCKLAKDNLASK